MLNSVNKFYLILKPKEKKRILILSILLFIGMIMEVLGIGLLVPFLEIISDENITNKYPIFNLIFNFFSIESFQDQTYFLLVLLFVLFFFKSIFLIFLNYKQFSFLQNLNSRIATELFSVYLNQNYLSFSKLKTANLIKHLTTDISYFVTFSTGVLSFVTELSLILAMMLTIIYIEPFGAFAIIFILTFFSLLLYQVSKKKIKNWGSSRNSLLEKNSKISLEALKGFRELLIFNQTDNFIKDFSSHRSKLSKVQAKMSTLSIIPRYYLEFAIIILFILFIFFNISYGNDIKLLIPVIGVFIAASFKMVPSFNKIIIALNNIKFFSNSVDILDNEFKLRLKNRSNSFNNSDKKIFQTSIRFNKVSFKYNRENEILNEINFQINIGDCIGIIGKSGEGKSTLIDLLVGILEPNKGEILIDNLKYKSMPNSLKNHISYISQNIFLFDSSIAENITMQKLNHNIHEDKLLIDSLKSVDLYEMVNNLPNGVYTLVGEDGIELSGGQKQRIAIARALYRKSKILVLDEATSNLDAQTEKKIIDSINSLRGKLTILIVSHKLSILNKCDYIYEVKGKKLNKINNDSIR